MQLQAANGRLPFCRRRLPGPPVGAARRGIARVQWLLPKAAASDEKSRSEPMYLSDLIAFETDSESEPAGPAAVPDAAGSSGSSAKGSSVDLAGSLGLAPSGDSDPTVRAQEIINRATEVLAAARAALGTSAPPVAGAAAAARAGAAAPPAAGGPAAAAAANSPPAAGRAARPSSSSPSGSASNLSSSSSSSSSMSSSDPGSSSSSSSSSGGSAAAEALTRRWSPLSEDQDLTRHVLQNALDQMQRSGAPIAAPKEPPSGSSSSSSTGGGLSGGSSAAGFKPAAGPGSSSGGGGGGGGGGAGPSAGTTGGSRSSSRDIRFGSSSSGLGSRGGGGAAVADSGHGPAPSWAQSLLGPDDFGASGAGYGQGRLFPPEPQLQRAEPAPAATAVMFADDEPPAAPGALSLLSQSAMDARKARSAVLPPLQSVMELTTAYKPPERSGGVAAAPVATAAATEAAAASEEEVAAPVGRALADGSGRLADGTWWEKKSGIEYGKNGYWKKWQLLRGGNAEGTLEWSETWWEASDWTGLKEMGAEKQGKNAEGDAWRESWSERLMYASNDLDCVVERNAHKWAAEASGDEWEEKWGEHYHASGKVAKFADKWGKAGPNVWHERWGEDYDSGGDACVKWTDKWAERLLPGGAREQWGDKWHEAFASGRGEKNGEVWSVAADGSRYQRWWGEHHLGDMQVRRFGHSTAGEQWDDTISMDTYYNPVPHFGFRLALQHSPQLKSVPLQPKPVNEADPFGPGLDQL